MEYMSGGNLAFHCERLKRFNENQVIFYSAQITCGLMFLHQKGFIHWFILFI